MSLEILDRNTSALYLIQPVGYDDDAFSPLLFTMGKVMYTDCDEGVINCSSMWSYPAFHCTSHLAGQAFAAAAAITRE